MTESRVAVLIPVYRAQRLLDRTIDSLRNERSKFEVFVVDDGSDPAIRIEDCNAFPIQLIRIDQNGGIARALNVGLGAVLSQGFDFIARLDAGDIHVPGRLEAQVDFLRRHPDHAAVGTACQVCSHDGSFLYEMRPPQTHEQIRKVLRVRNVFCHPSMMFNRRYLDSAHMYDESVGAEDYDAFLRILKTSRLANLPVAFVKYVIDENGISAKRMSRYIDRIKIQWRHFDFSNVYCYVGIIRSALMWLMPLTYARQHHVYAYLARLKARGTHH